MFYSNFLLSINNQNTKEIRVLLPQMTIVVKLTDSIILFYFFHASAGPDLASPTIGCRKNIKGTSLGALRVVYLIFFFSGLVFFVFSWFFMVQELTNDYQSISMSISWDWVVRQVAVHDPGGEPLGHKTF